MSGTRYLWRKLTPEQQKEVLAWRIKNRHPWHSPPHRPNYGHITYLISASCYEHAHHIGFTPDRMESFSLALLDVLQKHTIRIVAWCVLPNHYHALVETSNVLRLLYELGLLHGRTSHKWNGEETARGRKVFHRATERYMRSERHFFATLNYVHHNPVRHGYVRRWTEWPWCSATPYLDSVGRAEAEQIWKQYPIRDYGKKWDSPGL